MKILNRNINKKIDHTNMYIAINIGTIIRFKPGKSALTRNIKPSMTFIIINMIKIFNNFLPFSIIFKAQKN